jgi:hypothetical protein
MATAPKLSSDGHAEISDSDLRHEMFRELDARAREIEVLFRRTWVDFAEIVATMRDGGYWREGRYTSLHSWLKTACPCSRSWAYLAVGALDELKDIPLDELRQIPLKSAEILKKLPRSRRSDKKLLDAAKSLPPREFMPAVIEAFPDSHIESSLTLEYQVTKSQAKVILAGNQMWNLLNSEPMGPGEILEALWAQYMVEHKSQYEALNVQN